MIDLWADENEPETHYWSKVYLVRIPRASERTSSEQFFVYVEVDQYDIISIGGDSSWFGNKVDRDNIHKEIYDWLVEWELAEWKQIGPEDSEIFATEKLTKES